MADEKPPIERGGGLTLEEQLIRQEKRLGKDSYVAQMLRDQIHAKSRHRSAYEAYTSGRDEKDDEQ